MTLRRQPFSPFFERWLLYVDPFVSVEFCTADAESMTLRRQPVSPFFERRLLYVNPFFFVVRCIADVELMSLEFF